MHVPFYHGAFTVLSLNRGLKILCSRDLYSVTSWFMFWESVSSSEFTSADDISAGQNCLLYCFSDTRVTKTTTATIKDQHNTIPTYKQHTKPYQVYNIRSHKKTIHIIQTIACNTMRLLDAVFSFLCQSAVSTNARFGFLAFEPSSSKIWVTETTCGLRLRKKNALLDRGMRCKRGGGCTKSVTSY